MSVMELFAAFKTMILNFTMVDISTIFITPIIFYFFSICGRWEEIAKKENLSTIVWFYVIIYFWWVITFIIMFSGERILHYHFMFMGLIGVILYTTGHAIIERLLKPFNKKPRQ